MPLLCLLAVTFCFCNRPAQTNTSHSALDGNVGGCMGQGEGRGRGSTQVLLQNKQLQTVASHRSYHKPNQAFTCVCRQRLVV